MAKADYLLAVWACRLQELGLEKGWGNTAGRVLQTIKMLQDLLQAPDPDTLEQFLARIPMVFSVVIVSPHGYFGQAGVLGLPDTGGQVRFNPHSGCKYQCQTGTTYLVNHVAINIEDFTLI